MKKITKKPVKKAAKKVAKKVQPAMYVPEICTSMLVKKPVLNALKELEIDFTKKEINFELGPNCHINRDGFLTSNNLKQEYKDILTLVMVVYKDVQITMLNHRFGVDVIAKTKRK